MNRVIPNFPKALKTREPGLEGVIPPMVRIQARNHRTNIPRNEDGFFRDAKEFIKEFGPKGPYHNFPHLEDVLDRAFRILNGLNPVHRKAFGDEDALALKIAALCHDIVQNEYGNRDPLFTLTVNDICKLYGFEETEKEIRSLIMEAMNIGIQEDIDLSGVKRKLIEDPDLQIELSDEEMSLIVVDALAYRNGLDFELRCRLPGMIHATELPKTIVNRLPGYKWAQTPLAAILNAADIGGYLESFEKWIETSNLVCLELPEFKGKTVMDFIKAQIFFLEEKVLPSLDPEILPTIIGTDGEQTGSWMPEFIQKMLEEKLELLRNLKAEIEEIETGIKNWESTELSFVKGAVRRALGKSNPILDDESNPVPLCNAQMDSQQTTRDSLGSGRD